MSKKDVILVVDDQQPVREIIRDAVRDEYRVAEASNREEVVSALKKEKNQIAAVAISVTMNDMEGLELLRQYHQQDSWRKTPIVAMISREDDELEQTCIELGASDLVSEPVSKNQIRLRILKAIEEKELREIRYTQEYDKLTGLFNKQKAYEAVEELVQTNPEVPFVFVRMDIAKFQLINSFYGMREGDRLLRYISLILKRTFKGNDKAVCGRLQADIFCFCMPYEGRDAVISLLKKLREDINTYELDYDIVPVFGVYEIHDHDESATNMDDNANLASKQCKGNYIHNYAFYEESMGEQIAMEQRFVNSMKTAIAQEQFKLFIQPKYNLHTNSIDGGEVLVRWIVPGKGMVNPGKFIPVFERNGLIMRLDYYVWEHTCQIIRRWLDEDRKLMPLSVNVSRVSLYNPKLVEIICDLVEKYDIPPQLLQLELTESAYTDNPTAIKEAMTQLQAKGFFILMDDFGSGYSSLNVLKDIAVDILKIDMKFLSESEHRGRGENILAAVVRMAKWLDMPVIAEGVEKESQVSFLRSIGCEFVQGFYFASPMPVEDYEKLAFAAAEFGQPEEAPEEEGREETILWDTSSQMELLFADMLQAVAVCEYVPQAQSVEAIRVNNAYREMFGSRDEEERGEKSVTEYVDPEYRDEVLNSFAVVVNNMSVAECEFQHTAPEGRRWIGMTLKYVRKVGVRHVVFCTLSDISDQKKIEQELHRYRNALLNSTNKVETILIVDDIKMNRIMLKDIFDSEYNILEAQNGQEALDIARQNNTHIDLILLDMQMPVMDGPTFLQHKKEDISIADIPVVIITVDDSPQQQVDAVSMGVDDYIVKPFIPEVVIRRVCNVLDSRRKMGEVLQSSGESDDSRDELTGLYNRNEAGRMIQNAMQKSRGLHALLLIDINNYKQINDVYGQAAGERTIQDFARALRSCFRKSDILARYSGDEFVVFIMNLPTQEFLGKKCDTLIYELHPIHPLIKDGMKLEYSIGIATASSEEGCGHFMDLLGKADEALHKAREKGKNCWCVYEKD